MNITRERLVLPATTAARTAIAKPEAKPATSTEAKPADTKKPGKPSWERSKNDIREFAFPDGRKISIHRHSVHWATPLKSDPENATLAGVRGGEHPVPLQIVYADFVAWWKA